MIETGRFWASLESLEDAQQATGLEVAAHEVEGVMLRLALARGHWARRWQREARERRHE